MVRPETHMQLHKIHAHATVRMKKLLILNHTCMALDHAIGQELDGHCDVRAAWLS